MAPRRRTPSGRAGAGSSGKLPVNLIAFGTLCSAALFLGVHWGVSRGAAEEPEQHAQQLMRTVTQLSAGLPSRAASVLAQSEAAEAASVDARHAFGALKVKTVRNVGGWSEDGRAEIAGPSRFFLRLDRLSRAAVQQRRDLSRQNLTTTTARRRELTPTANLAAIAPCRLRPHATARRACAPSRRKPPPRAPPRSRAPPRRRFNV